MNLQIAIVGLPNVGKSTLFNALTKSNAAQAANYPFCTIDPNVGVVEVPDSRLKALAEVCNPQKVIPAIVEFVDVAGLVKGASQGEGLGNQFLSHIRECHAVAEVVRVFKDSNVIHVHNSVEPKRDREVLESELILADLQTLEKRMGKTASEARGGDKEKVALNALLERLKPELGAGKLASQVLMTDEEKLLLRDLHLITMKPLMILVNVGEEEVATVDVEELRKILDVPAGTKVIPISAKVEADLVSFSEEEAASYLKDLGLQESGLHRVIREAYDILGLQTYFTAGEKEVRAWTVRKGALAPEAAGVIHTDFEKGFIKAEVISWKDFVECRGEVKAREKGLLRIEGKEYTVRDGDVMHFRHSA